MKCLRKYEWVKLPRDYPDMGKGLMSSWAKLASRAAFRKGNAYQAALLLSEPYQRRYLPDLRRLGV